MIAKSISKDADSESDSGDTWRANLNDAEQMHVLAAAGISPDGKKLNSTTMILRSIKNKLSNGRRVENVNVNEI
jgi:hypothetical protein